jgi:hypothetical protein
VTFSARSVAAAAGRTNHHDIVLANLGLTDMGQFVDATIGTLNKIFADGTGLPSRHAESTYRSAVA